MDRPVEAELLLDGGDQFRVETLRARVLRAPGLDHIKLRLGIDRAGDTGRGFDVLPGEVRDHLVDRTAGSELDDEKVDRDDPDQRRKDQQQPPCDVTKHARPPLRMEKCITQRRTQRARAGPLNARAYQLVGLTAFAFMGAHRAPRPGSENIAPKVRS